MTMPIESVEQPSILLITGHHKEIQDIHCSIKVRPLDGVYKIEHINKNPTTYEGELFGRVYLGGIHGLCDLECKLNVLNERIIPADYVGDILGNVTLAAGNQSIERGE